MDSVIAIFAKLPQLTHTHTPNWLQRFVQMTSKNDIPCVTNHFYYANCRTMWIIKIDIIIFVLACVKWLKFMLSDRNADDTAIIPATQKKSPAIESICRIQRFEACTRISHLNVNWYCSKSEDYLIFQIRFSTFYWFTRLLDL